MTDTEDITPTPGGRRLRGLVIAGGAGLAVAGLGAYLKRRRAPWSADEIDLPDQAAHEQAAHEAAAVSDSEMLQSDPAHAPGHTHLAPPEQEAEPPTGDRAGRAYEPGHRDRGGRSAAFHTERGR